MNRTVFRDAITLFEYSTTAKGGRGPVGKWAGLVIKRLWELYKASEIGFVRQDSDNTRGSWDPGQPFINLQVNPHYINSLPENQRLAAISLVLVHEGVHAALDFLDDKSIYSELAARKLTVYYYRELSGPGVFNEATDPPAPGTRAQLILLPRNAFPEYVKMSRFLDRDQLIDYILEIPSYTDPDDPAMDRRNAVSLGWAQKSLARHQRALRQNSGEESPTALRILYPYRFGKHRQSAGLGRHDRGSRKIANDKDRSR